MYTYICVIYISFIGLVDPDNALLKENIEKPSHFYIFISLFDLFSISA